jgi:transposase
VSVSFPYHPEYGLPNEYRTRVVFYALATSVVSATLHFNVHQSTVYRWTKDANLKEN